ncbi:biopolymer transporter ExbD [[Phormidium ambiguum] IAM M-71]|uniref:Biopolymer transporter ExbD n=1 Tax=[Phormidium ambiguum] IAM M-71 TaxID=454136 RepID=A0A1U7IKT7_9CYAN|nr:biopolymer transporter ExbD [Phormidium ambiguum]OKH37851.1 biopolymer transporter ExbD [Phormidium ambiguum IAM M-71]
MRLPDESENNMGINITPMIDVIFSILAYFIVSSLSLTRSEGLPVNLPQASTAQAQKTEQINVSILPDGAIALNRQPIALEKLEAEVKAKIPPNTESLVILNADKAVDHGRVVEVMDKLRRVKGAKLAIATQKQS